MRIGIDLLGSESSPQNLYDGAVMALDHMEDDETIVAFVTEAEAANLVCVEDPRLELQWVEESIDTHEDPMSAVRHKKESSLVVGVRELNEGKIDAFVSAGNTGALIVASTILLPTFSGMECPALMVLLPTEKRPLAMMDVGGSLSWRPENLVQFAHMAAAFQRCRLGIATPTVGLLNVGEESGKGKTGIREAYRLLQEESNSSEAKIHFVGNVEGREVFRGGVDVLVADGFTGNVMLKTSEGMSSFILEYFHQALGPSASAETLKVLQEIELHFSYDEYPGAVVCGVDGLVIKCHGAASARGFMHSIIGAVELVKAQFLLKMREEFPLS